MICPRTQRRRLAIQNVQHITGNRIIRASQTTCIAHWRTLNYLPHFYPGDPSDVPAFRRVETSSFPKAIETFEASRADITLRVISFGLVANTVLAAYQFLSTGPLAVDLRFTAPDVGTASNGPVRHGRRVSVHLSDRFRSCPSRSRKPWCWTTRRGRYRETHPN
jgi:hypothetical protein